MYRIKVTGYVQYLEGEDPDTSLQNRAYGEDLADIKYSNLLLDPSILDRNFKTEEEARVAMAKSYRGVDDYGLMELIAAMDDAMANRIHRRAA